MRSAGEHSRFEPMLSLEPATVTDRRYPELFQTGETAYGKPIVDGQHPHDFVMELALALFASAGRKDIVGALCCAGGRPRAGSGCVSTPGFGRGITAGHARSPSTGFDSYLLRGCDCRDYPWHCSAWRPAAFMASEPNENRWNIGHGAIDSYSARVTVIAERELERPDFRGASDSAGGAGTGRSGTHDGFGHLQPALREGQLGHECDLGARPQNGDRRQSERLWPGIGGAICAEELCYRPD